MAEQEQAQEVQNVEEDEEDNANYKPPAPKALEDIINQDAEDESLRKYKEALLGAGGATGAAVIIDEKNPNKVIIDKLSLLVEDRDEVSIDLKRSAEEIKKDSFSLKEGCKYRIKIYFFVQREIVSGLRYEHKVQRKGINVDKMRCMMGSYGPKPDQQSFTTAVEDAPSGLLMRGDYKIKSRFVDDDGNEYVSWEWHLAVKKDW